MYKPKEANVEKLTKLAEKLKQKGEFKEEVCHDNKKCNNP
jgi:hypothetical protein